MQVAAGLDTTRAAHQDNQPMSPETNELAAAAAGRETELHRLGEKVDLVNNAASTAEQAESALHQHLLDATFAQLGTSHALVGEGACVPHACNGAADKWTEGKQRLSEGQLEQQEQQQDGQVHNHQQQLWNGQQGQQLQEQRLSAGQRDQQQLDAWQAPREREGEQFDAWQAPQDREGEQLDAWQAPQGREGEQLDAWQAPQDREGEQLGYHKGDQPAAHLSLHHHQEQRCVLQDGKESEQVECHRREHDSDQQPKVQQHRFEAEQVESHHRQHDAHQSIEVQLQQQQQQDVCGKYSSIVEGLDAHRNQRACVCTDCALPPSSDSTAAQLPPNQVSAEKPGVVHSGSTGLLDMADLQDSCAHCHVTDTSTCDPAEGQSGSYRLDQESGSDEPVPAQRASHIEGLGVCESNCVLSEGLGSSELSASMVGVDVRETNPVDSDGLGSSELAASSVGVRVQETMRVHSGGVESSDIAASSGVGVREITQVADSGHPGSSGEPASVQLASHADGVGEGEGTNHVDYSEDLGSSEIALSSIGVDVCETNNVINFAHTDLSHGSSEITSSSSGIGAHETTGVIDCGHPEFSDGSSEIASSSSGIGAHETNKVIDSGCSGLSHGSSETASSSFIGAYETIEVIHSGHSGVSEGLSEIASCSVGVDTRDTNHIAHLEHAVPSEAASSSVEIEVPETCSPVCTCSMDGTTQNVTHTAQTLAGQELGVVHLGFASGGQGSSPTTDSEENAMENTCATPKAGLDAHSHRYGHLEGGAALPLDASPSHHSTPHSPSLSASSTTHDMTGPEIARRSLYPAESDPSAATSPMKSCVPSSSQAACIPSTAPVPFPPLPGTAATPVIPLSQSVDHDSAADVNVNLSLSLSAADVAVTGPVGPTAGASDVGVGRSSTMPFSAAAITWLRGYLRSSSMSESSTAERRRVSGSTADDAAVRCSSVVAGTSRAAICKDESVNAESASSSRVVPSVTPSSTDDSAYQQGESSQVAESSARCSHADSAPCNVENTESSSGEADCALDRGPMLGALSPRGHALLPHAPCDQYTPMSSTWWRASQYAYSLMGSVAFSFTSSLRSSAHLPPPTSTTPSGTSAHKANISVPNTPSLCPSFVSTSTHSIDSSAITFCSLPICTRHTTSEQSEYLSCLSPPHSLSRNASSNHHLNASLNILPSCVQQTGDGPASLLSLDTGVLTYMISEHLKPNRRACAALRATCKRLRNVVNSTTTVLQVSGRSLQLEGPRCLTLWQNRPPHTCLAHAGFTNVDTLVLKIAERDSGNGWDCPAWNADTPWPTLTPSLQHSVRTVVVHVYGVRVEGRRCEPDVLRVLALLHRLPSLSTLMWVQRGRWSLADLPVLQQLPTTLTTLYFYHRKMGPMDCMRSLLTGLVHLTNLRQLHIHHLPVTLLPCLAPLSRLQKVTGVMASSAMALLQLEHMSLGDIVSSVTLNKSKLWLSPAPHLTSLVLNKCQVQPTALKNAAWLKSLKMYSCTSVARFVDLVPLFELRCLTQLHVLSSHATISSNRGQWWLNRAVLDALQQLQPDMMATRTLLDLNLVLQVEEAHQFGALPKLGLLNRLQSLYLFFLQGWPTVPCAGPHASAMLLLLMGHSNIKQLKAFHVSLYEPAQVLALQTPLSHPSFSQLLTCHLTFHVTTPDMPAVLSVLRSLSGVKLHVDLKLEEGSYGSMSDMLRVLCTALCELPSLCEVRLCTPMLNVCPINDADSLLMLRSLSKLQRLEIDTSFGVGSGARVHGDVLEAVQELERIGVSAELLSGYMCLPQRVPPMCTLPQRAWVRQLAALLLLGWWFLQ